MFACERSVDSFLVYVVVAEYITVVVDAIDIVIIIIIVGTAATTTTGAAAAAANVTRAINICHIVIRGAVAVVAQARALGDTSLATSVTVTG